MDKEEYLYTVIDDIKKAKKIKEESIKTKEFYSNKNDSNSLVNYLNNNIQYANKFISLVDDLKYLPIYEIIKIMDDNTVINYKNKFISEYKEEIKKEESFIENLNSKINEYIQNRKDNLDNYEKHKKAKDIKKSDLNIYLENSDYLYEQIKKLKTEILKHNNTINKINIKINILNNKDIEEIRKEILDRYKLSNIEKELDKHKANRFDKVIYNLSSNLQVIDKIEEKINEYNKIANYIPSKSIIFPDVDDYKIRNYSIISDYILKEKIETNKIVLSDVKNIDDIIERANYVLNEIDLDKKRLLKFKLKTDEMSNITFGYINKELVNYITNLCDDSELKDKIVNLYNKYMKLVNKKSKSNYSVNKSIRIEHELVFEIRDFLDCYWYHVCEELESIISRINNNGKFMYNFSLKNIKGFNTESIIFDCDNFSEIGLLNMRILIENILNKYTEINNSLESFCNDLIEIKDNIINTNIENNMKMIDIKNTIDELYYKVAPNEQQLSTSDYAEILNILKNKKIIDSIVKVERENLISRVKLESVKYKDIEEKDINNTLKKVFK